MATGLEGVVRCRCLEEGTVRDPPVPRDALRVDEDGMLEVSSEIPDRSDLLYQLLRWQETCCDHRDMSYHQEAFGTWELLGFFVQALGELGWEDFPVLEEFLPRAPKGRVDPEVVPAARIELREVRARIEAGMAGWRLRVAGEDTTLLRSVGRSKSRLLLGASTGVDLVLHDGVFQMIRAKDQTLLFRSRTILQHPLVEEERGHFEAAVMVCAETADTYRSPLAFLPDGLQRKGPLKPQRVPTRLEVEAIALGVADFAPVLEPLERILEAAETVGNPVRWM